jgi:hypothetical protein
MSHVKFAPGDIKIIAKGLVILLFFVMTATFYYLNNIKLVWRQGKTNTKVACSGG